MINLSLQQKKLLLAFYNRTKNYMANSEIISKVEALNDFETLWSACDRFLWDLHSATQYGTQDEIAKIMKNRY